MQYKIINGSRWLNVFYHDSSEGHLFTPENVLNFKRTKMQFSILGKMKYFVGHKSKYEFILEYKEIDDSIHFIQDENPLSINEGEEVKGFHIFSGKNVKYFKGLYRSNQAGNTLLESDSRSSEWWRCAIGTFICFRSNQIPGPATTEVDGYDVKNVSLWLRINRKTARVNVIERHKVLICMFNIIFLVYRS